MKEGKLLKSLKNNVNTMSTGIIQPYSKVLIDNNDTSMPKLGSSQNHISSDGIRKSKSSMKQNYLKKNKRISTLTSASNLKKQLTSSKSFSSLFNRHFAKQSSSNFHESERWRQLEKIGQEKGVHFYFYK